MLTYRSKEFITILLVITSKLTKGLDYAAVDYSSDYSITDKTLFDAVKYMTSVTNLVSLTAEERIVITV